MFFFNMPVKCVLCIKSIVENLKRAGRTDRQIKSIVKAIDYHYRAVKTEASGFSNHIILLGQHLKTE